MQKVMILPVTRLRRILPLLSLAVWLAGCTARPSPVPPPPDITAQDLATAARVAYQQGFEAGRRYQRRVELRRSGSSRAAAQDEKFPELSDSKVPPPFNADESPVPDSGQGLAQTSSQASAPASAPSLSSKAAGPPAPSLPQPAPLPPLPPSASYTTSGPAQPLQ